MQIDTFINRLDRWLYRGRFVLSAFALLFVLYCTIYLWFYVPYGGPLTQWQPDSQLVVLAVQPDSSLQVGDAIKQIDGKSPVRMRPIYPLPLQDSYEFIVQRGTEVITQTVAVAAPINADIVSSYLPATLIAFIGWLVGTIMLFWAKEENRQAVHVGLIFLLGGVVLSGVQASLEGAPGAWIGGHVLIFWQFVAWVYLATVPRDRPLSAHSRRWLGTLAMAATLLAGTAVYEVFVLFPKSTSFQELVGMSLYELGLFLAAFGLVVCIVLLINRVWRLPTQSFLRQQLIILIVFMSTGILPIILLTIVPRVLTNSVLLPFPVAIGLLIFIPLGYLFVIYRNGFLGLDLIFSRILYLVLLSLTVYSFYMGIYLLIRRLLGVSGGDAIGPTTIIFFPTLLLTIGLSKQVSRFVNHIIYGPKLFTQAIISELTAVLATKPETVTLHYVATRTAELLQADRVALLLQEGSHQAVAIGWGDAHPKALLDVLREMGVKRPYLRTDIQNEGTVGQLFSLCPWASLFVPVIVRQETIGVLAFSAPDVNGYFNVQQLAFVEQIANRSAVSSENVVLFEAVRQLSRERLAVEEAERKRLATAIHDDPLQRLTYATTLLDQLLLSKKKVERSRLDETLQKSAEQLRTINRTLRDICVGIYPHYREQGVEMTIQDVVCQFENEYGLTIDARVEGDDLAQDVPEMTVTAVYRVLIESLNNVVKHARHADVNVSLRRRPQELELCVADNGPGHQLQNLSFSELLRRNHMGIVGMHEWARMVQGDLRLVENKPKGLAVLMRCPI
ncbi:MAG: GAF domain-containing protein [Chloroflexi bacterium]|nr:GAF domain-containing protein [Chloroflexota bacterium]